MFQHIIFNEDMIFIRTFKNINVNKRYPEVVNNEIQTRNVCNKRLIAYNFIREHLRL